MKIIPLTISLSILCITIGNSATTTFTLISNSTTTTTQAQDASGAPLTAGTTARGDGAIIQLGYFSTSIDDPSRVWIAIAGLGSLNSSIDMRVGDYGTTTSPDGTFSTPATFDGTENGLPSSDTQQLAIRFYDTVSAASLGSANYNTITNTTWLYQFPTAQGANSNFQLTTTEGTTTWEDGGANAFKTTISAVPEPSSFALLGLGGVALLFRRRK